MKILSRSLFALFLLIGVLIAVSNSQPVQLSLWPLPHLVVMPLYLLVVGLLLLGVLAGLVLGWWGGRHHRRRAKLPAIQRPLNRSSAGSEIERSRERKPCAAA